MNRLIIEITMAGIILVSGMGLYYMVKKNGELSNENKNLVATVEETQTAIMDLGVTITELQTKYTKVSNDEFTKFKKTDISKVPMSKFVPDYNNGIKRVLKDYKNRTTKFVTGNTKTASPGN